MCRSVQITQVAFASAETATAFAVLTIQVGGGWGPSILVSQYPRAKFSRARSRLYRSRFLEVEYFGSDFLSRRDQSGWVNVNRVSVCVRG